MKAKSHFLIGITDSKQAWLRVVGVQGIETILIQRRGEYFCNTAQLDMEILTASFCAMSLDLRLFANVATVYPVSDGRFAPLVVAPPYDLTPDAQRVPKESDTDDELRSTANYAVVAHKWDGVFEAIAQYLDKSERAYRVGFDTDTVYFGARNGLEDRVAILSFLDVYSRYSALFQ